MWLALNPCPRWLKESGHTKSETKHLLKLLEKVNPTFLRVYALTLLYHLDSEQALKKANELISDPEVDVRYFSCSLICDSKKGELDEIEKVIDKAKLSDIDQKELLKAILDSDLED